MYNTSFIVDILSYQRIEEEEEIVEKDLVEYCQQIAMH